MSQNLAASVVRAGLALAAAALCGASAAAQVATDGSLGARVSQTGDVAIIQSDLGRRSGENLFHSFDSFSVETGGGAIFGVPDGVARVISRVTGPDGTTIDGFVAFLDDPTLTNLVSADFWLVNPNGVMIGENAAFPTGGALYFSGGDTIRFADGADFSADLSQPLSITSAAPEAFGFLGRRPGPVKVSGGRVIAKGDGLTLAGGRITVEDAVLTGGTQDITLIAGGEGDIAPVRPTAPVVLTSGKIRIVSTGAAGAQSASIETSNGGDVQLYAGEIVIDGGRAVALTGAAPGGDVAIAADRLRIRDGGQVGTLTTGAGAAGNTAVSARDIALVRGGAIRSQTQAGGDAGSISVLGFDRLLLSRGGEDVETAIESETSIGAGGDAGLVLVQGGALRLIDGGGVFSNTFGDGDAGAVQVDVATILGSGGAQIASGARDNPEQNILATGAGGAVRVTASESIEFRGTLRPRPTDPPGAEVESSGILSATEGRLTGRGGDLFASAPVIILSNEAEIGAETFFAARAGDLVLEGAELQVSGGAEISTTSRRTGRAGNVALSFSDSVTLPARGSIASSARRDQGAAGRVEIATGRLFVGQGSRLTTQSLASDGGAIIVNASQSAFIDGGNVTTSVASSSGNGGSILIRGGPLALGGSGLIESRALAGDGGTVTIAAGATFIETPDAAIDVSSAFGQDGVIRILGVVGDQTGDTEAPEAEFFNRFALIDDFCVAAVTGGSALRLVAAEAPPTAALAPALFGGAIPYPAADGQTAELVLALAAPAACEAVE